MKTVLSLLSLAFLTVPAFAADATTCKTPEHVLTDKSVTVIVNIPIVGSSIVDQEIIVVYEANEFLWLFKGGCSPAPLLLGPVVAPAVTPQKTPVLHGGGAEIGA